MTSIKSDMALVRRRIDDFELAMEHSFNTHARQDNDVLALREASEQVTRARKRLEVLIRSYVEASYA